MKERENGWHLKAQGYLRYMTTEPSYQKILPKKVCDAIELERKESERDYHERNIELENENAKLRELVREMFDEIELSGFDPLVERNGKRGPYYEEDPSWRVKIRERMRELGI